MAVSTDGVLLGAWTRTKPNARIIDIGTGTGLLSLMCAQRFPQAQITAVDINSLAIENAQTNIRRSPWGDRITLLNQDILSWDKVAHFDTIICNPPYFNSGESSAHFGRAIARHSDALPHHKLLDVCWSMLGQDGKASFILPVKEGRDFIDMAIAKGWFLTRLCDVSPTEHKPVNRRLIELSKLEKTTSYSKLTVRKGNEYSAEFVALTKEFYLKM